MPPMLRSLNVLSLVFALLYSTPASASVDRLTALGGLNRATIDDSNSFLFPATISEWPRFEVELFDEWAGIAYPLSNRHTLGLFFNRRPSNLNEFSNYIRQSGSDLFQSMVPSPWIDIAYGYVPSREIAFGAMTSIAYDRSTLGHRTTSASNADLRMGLRFGSGAGSTVDLGIGLLIHRLQDQNPAGDQFKHTDGTGLSLDLRYRRSIGRKTLWLPYIGFKRDAVALAPEQRRQTLFQFGMGLQVKPARGVVLVAAIDTRYQHNQQSTASQPVSEKRDLLLPAWVLASETQVGSTILRLGMRHESWLSDNEQYRGTEIVKNSLFETKFTTQIGLGFKFANLALDGLLERDFLRDGPHFIGGSRHGGGILSHLSLTYRFATTSE